MISSDRLALLLALGAIVLLVAVYAVAFGTAAGLRVDERAIPVGLAGPNIAQAEVATSRLLNTISLASLALAGAGIVAIAVARRRPRHAVVAAGVIVGANLATQALKPLLGELDLLGGDAERFSQGIFPSGHATVAMSLALALVIVVPPQARPLAAAASAGYAAAIGVGLLLLGWHFPSDVAGGFLVAATLAGIAVAWLRSRAAKTSPDPATLAPPAEVRRGVILALALAGAVAVAAAVAIGLRVGDVGQLARYGRLHTAFFGGSAAIAALALALPAAVAALMLRGAASRATPSDRHPT